MIIEVIQKEQNKRLVTRQTEGPFESWESIQEFQSNGDKATLVSHVIDYQLPTTGKIVNFLTGSQAEVKLKTRDRTSSTNSKTKTRIPINITVIRPNGLVLSLILRYHPDYFMLVLIPFNCNHYFIINNLI